MANPIGIVPLVEQAVPAEEATRTAAQTNLVDQGGPKLEAVEVVTVFWGPYWLGPGQPLIAQVNGFFDYYLTSRKMDAMRQYGCRYGRRSGTHTLADPDPGTRIDDEAIRAQLKSWIDDRTLPQPTANSAYFVYMQSGTTVTIGNDESCQAFCAYHDFMPGGIYYAVIPFPACSGCSFGSTLKSLTKMSSHELCDTITDPAGDAWKVPGADPGKDEVADLCNSSTVVDGNYVIQAEWSNASGACVFEPTFGGQSRVDVGTSFRPALAAFRDRLYMAWKGSGDENIWWASFDGSSWGGQNRMGDIATSGGVALAEYRDRLYMAWRGRADDDGIYWRSYDGSSWSGQTRVNVGTSVGPALATFRDRLYMAWKGAGSDEGIYWASFDGSSWSGQTRVNVGTSVGPALASYDDRLFMAWKGGGGDQGIYWSTFDGSSWANQQRLDVGTTFGPALAAYGSLYMAWKGGGDNENLWWTSYNAGSWAGQSHKGDVATAVGPALATYRNLLYMAWRGRADDAGIYWAVL